jgi:hypothetical protein
VMAKFPSRAALLVPVLSLGLLVSGFDPSLTQADTLPLPCELMAAVESAEDATLMLSAILPADLDLAVAIAPPIPYLAPPPPPGVPQPPGGDGAPKPLGTDLRPPDPSLLNQEPIMAVRQLRESLSETQKADLRAVLTKHQSELQQVRGRLPVPSTGPQGNRSVKADRNASLHQATADVTRISDQIDQEIVLNLTPTQRALLEKSRPKRLRSELPNGTPDAVVAAGESAC